MLKPEPVSDTLPHRRLCMPVLPLCRPLPSARHLYVIIIFVARSNILPLCFNTLLYRCSHMCACQGNVLLLRGEMFIHPDQSYVTLDELLTQLSTCIMDKKPSEVRVDDSFQVSSCSLIADFRLTCCALIR